MTSISSQGYTRVQRHWIRYMITQKVIKWSFTTIFSYSLYCQQLMYNSGVRSSLDVKCHDQLVHCKISVRTPPLPSSEQRVWYYQRANVGAIQRSLTEFPWDEQFLQNENVNEQVKIFTDTVLNVMSNFVPNEVKQTKS